MALIESQTTCHHIKPDPIHLFCGFLSLTLFSLSDSDAIDDPEVTYTSVVEVEDSGSEQVSVGTPEVLGQQHQVSLVTQDGTTQQVSIHVTHQCFPYYWLTFSPLHMDGFYIILCFSCLFAGKNDL